MIRENVYHVVPLPGVVWAAVIFAGLLIIYGSRGLGIAERWAWTTTFAAGVFVTLLGIGAILTMSDNPFAYLTLILAVVEVVPLVIIRISIRREEKMKNRHTTRWLLLFALLLLAVGLGAIEIPQTHAQVEADCGMYKWYVFQTCASTGEECVLVLERNAPSEMQSLRNVTILGSYRTEGEALKATCDAMSTKHDEGKSPGWKATIGGAVYDVRNFVSPADGHCSSPWPDEDDDGVPDFKDSFVQSDVDTCLNTPRGAVVNMSGCPCQPVPSLIEPSRKKTRSFGIRLISEGDGGAGLGGGVFTFEIIELADSSNDLLSHGQFGEQRYFTFTGGGLTIGLTATSGVLTDWEYFRSPEPLNVEDFEGPGAIMPLFSYGLGPGYSAGTQLFFVNRKTQTRVSMQKGFAWTAGINFVSFYFGWWEMRD